jgi:hypothetical protein
MGSGSDDSAALAYRGISIVSGTFFINSTLILFTEKSSVFSGLFDG